MSTVALLTALLALAGGVVGLVFDVKPEWRPDPRTDLGATMSVFSTEPNVSAGDWLKRASSTRSFAANRQHYIRTAVTDPRSKSEARAALAVTGTLHYVQTTIRGFKRKNLTLAWSIYRLPSKQRIRLPGFQEVPAAGFLLTAPSDSSLALVWTPEVPRPGRYFARFELRTDTGTLLSVTDSKPFAGLT